MTNFGSGKSGVVATDSFPVLYILMRNDLASMNAGKGMAQASHASNAFWRHINDTVFDLLEDDDATGHEIERLANIWQNDTSQGFGTVLVLGVNETQMRTAVDIAEKLDYVAGVVHDSTYPIQIPLELGWVLTEVDGHHVFEVGEKANYVTIPLDTCAYIFGDKNDPVLGAMVGCFPLHP